MLLYGVFIMVSCSFAACGLNVGRVNIVERVGGVISLHDFECVHFVDFNISTP